MFCYNARMTIKKKSFAKGVPRRRKVVLALNLSGAAGRSMLAGVSRYLSEGHLWRLEIFQLPDAPAADSLRRLERDGLDGYVVTDLGPPDGVDVLSQSRLPAVFVNVSEERFARWRGGTAFIWNDNDDIGRRAAAQLRAFFLADFLVKWSRRIAGRTAKCKARPCASSFLRSCPT